MKSTKAVLDTFEIEESDKVHCVFEFDLHREDYKLVFESMTFLKAQIDVDEDMADHLFSLLTYGIHKATEERTGKPFVLRMDRPKN